MRRAGVTVFLLLELSLGSWRTASRGWEGPSQAGDSAPPASAYALRVVDGDTVVIAIDGRRLCVRLIGVDTPETVHPKKPVERFGRESAGFLKNLIDGKDVRVEYEHEPGPARLDRYGRTLGYLYLEPDRLFVNREIIARGYGHAYTKYPFRYLDDFRAAEQAAREGRLGLWGPEPGEQTGRAPATREETVRITRSGSKYHRPGCRYLGASALTAALDQVAARYAPCAVCNLPAWDGAQRP